MVKYSTPHLIILDNIRKIENLNYIRPFVLINQYIYNFDFDTEPMNAETPSPLYLLKNPLLL